MAAAFGWRPAFMLCVGCGVEVLPGCGGGLLVAGRGVVAGFVQARSGLDRPAALVHGHGSWRRCGWPCSAAGVLCRPVARRRLRLLCSCTGHGRRRGTWCCGGLALMFFIRQIVFLPDFDLFNLTAD
ncbi:hypothetical protein VPH35_014274 [Triticum aestivum]|uniref:Uncharacterized protein n=1 Tax=Aegilops tauschii TaxID=37682 RepID=M8C4U4_AEGTA